MNSEIGGLRYGDLEVEGDALVGSMVDSARPMDGQKISAN